MKRLGTYLLIFTLVLFLCAVAGARDMQKLSEDIPADSEVKTIHLKIDVGLATLSLKTHAGGDMLTAYSRYDADKIKADVEYEKSGSEADIFLTSDQFKKKFHLDSDDCRWKISLSRDYIWDIEFDAGFAECRMDLSGLPVERLRLDLGASECRVQFDEPNPEPMRKFSVDAGAGEVRILGIGYANCDDFSFDGGAGEFTLNFEGMIDGFRRAKIDVGVGEVKVELPEDLPVRIEANEGWLSSLNVYADDLDMSIDGLFETGDFDEAEYGLQIDLDIGIGEATVTMVD
ncbi:MAG: cell wall-active antibiotics response protein [FCB group bacterium]|nr:cell wall-active antibiotics response protein [FCB group bacterium]